MARGPWMVQKVRKVGATLLAETATRDALACVLEQPSPLRVDGRKRRVVAYCDPRVATDELVAALRELADELEQEG